jgi:predicted DNA-binding protein YlxM (UPF0122 family)
MKLTLGEAAKETNVTKSAISKAIKSGRISAIKNDLGEYEIEPSELFRVYQPKGVNSQPTVAIELHETPNKDSGLQGVLDALRELLEQVKNERDDLRRRLDNEEEERRQTAAEVRRLTLLITHQPETVKQQETTANQNKRPWWSAPLWLWLVLILAVSGAAVVWLLTWWKP